MTGPAGLLDTSGCGWVGRQAGRLPGAHLSLRSQRSERTPGHSLPGRFLQGLMAGPGSCGVLGSSGWLPRHPGLRENHLSAEATHTHKHTQRRSRLRPVTS